MMGRVYLMGAGPGAADLISVRGWRLLHEADVVLMDELLPPSFLADLGISHRPPIVECVRDDGGRASQDTIHGAMANHALLGRTVVRLKGGDPFVFGRGQEEVEYLDALGIPWEVIPGPTSATAVLTAAGLPLTRREEGRSFAVATARLSRGHVQNSFPRADSLVILMGVKVLPQVVESLMAQGWPAEAPAALIERGTLLWERRVEAPLASLAERAAEARIQSPAAIVVGNAARPDRVRRRRILFTGPDPAGVRILGDILHWPALAEAPDMDGLAQLPHALDEIESGIYDVVAFTCSPGVVSFFNALAERGRDARRLANLHVVAVGTGPARRLREYGVIADRVVGDSGSLAAIPWISWDHARSVLVVQGGECPESSMDGHALPASRVRRIRLLRTVPHPDLGRPLPDHDVICLTRPEDVSVYWDVYGRGAFCGEVWCTGERTRAALHDLGLRAEVVIGDVPRGMAWPRSSPVPAAHSAVPALAEIPMARDGAGN